MRDGLCFYVRTAKTLQALSRMEGMTRVCTIMMDGKESEETIAATTQSAKTNNNPNKILIIAISPVTNVMGLIVLLKTISININR